MAQQYRDNPSNDDHASSEEESYQDEEDYPPSDHAGLVELGTRGPHRQHTDFAASPPRPPRCVFFTSRRIMFFILSILSIVYFALKYEVDEVKWIANEFESDLLRLKGCNSTAMSSEPIQPFVPEPVAEDYNFSSYEPLGPYRFYNYATGVSPEINSGMVRISDEVARTQRIIIVNAMRFVWERYKQHAWGKDEMGPVSGRGVDGWGGMGLTLVDALDTLWIMGLTSEFNEGRDWVKAELSHTLVGEVSTFETTIRSLGGLISAYDLSNDIVFLKQAEYLAPRLFKAFDSPSGLPRGRVNLKTGQSHNSGSGHSYILAEVASLQLEFRYMAHATGKTEYATKSEAVFDTLARITPRDGLMPLNIKERRNGNAYFSSKTVSFGGMGDSAYEYMLKLWLQGGKTEKKYRDMWDKAVNGMHHNLLKKSSPNGLTYIADRTGGKVGNTMSHLTCFMGGALALGAYTDPDGMNSPRAERDLKTAKALAYTCYQMYARSATGLSPESVVFTGCNDFEISKTNTAFLLRPEAVESFYYLNKLTGDPIYREWGWEIFQSIEKYCKTKYGYASLKNVDLPSLQKIDKMESYFLAETLKYLYLLFDPDSEIDLLTKHVFNTEGHLLKIFKAD